MRLTSLIASLCIAAAATLVGCAAPSSGAAPAIPTLSAEQRAQRVAEVRAAETAFAQTMAQRDFNAFSALIAEDAVFINGGQPLRGKVAIGGFWKRFFEKPAAPFAWTPEIVEVNASGDLGYTEGPVSSPDGKTFAKFYSVWRRSADGRWLVVFDNGTNVCPACPPVGK